MTEEDRSYFLTQLAATGTAFENAVTGLSPAQAAFKPAPDRWSIEELVEHVAVSEHGMYRLISEHHKLAEHPHETESAAAISRVRDRKTQPLKAPDRVLPKNRFGGLAEALEKFLENRARTVEFVKTCNDDLRLRLIQHPAGLVNGRDCLRILTFHPARHVEQIDEVKAHVDYPR